MGESEDVALGDDWNGLVVMVYPLSYEVCIWEDGEGTASYYLTLDEAAELRDSLSRWLNEGGK